MYENCESSQGVYAQEPYCRTKNDDGLTDCVYVPTYIPVCRGLKVANPRVRFKFSMKNPISPNFSDVVRHGLLTLQFGLGDRTREIAILSPSFPPCPPHWRSAHPAFSLLQQKNNMLPALLKRGPASAGDGNLPHKRRRPVTSCEPCRSRKIRCDQDFPCGPCKRARKGTRCLYRPGEQNTGCREGKDVHPTELTVPAALSEVRDPESHQSSSPSNSVLPIGSNYATEDLVTRVLRLESAFETYEKKFQQPSQATSLGSEQTLSTSLQPSQAARFKSNQNASKERFFLRNNPEKTRLFGQSHWMYIAQTLVCFLSLPAEIVS